MDNPSIKRLTTVGIPVDAIESLSVVTDAIAAAVAQHRPWLMTFANPATAIAAKRNPALCAMLEKFDLVGPDGIGMTIAMKVLHQQPALRISFDSTSLAPDVFLFAEGCGLTVVLCGGAPGVAEKARQEILAVYPRLQIVGVFDGFADAKLTQQTILKLAPSIVIAGMGVFVQEMFLLSLVDQGWRGLGFTCGGYLDQLSVAGTDYYPAWVDKHDLRWAYRLVKEPRRLWRRYLVEYPEFGLDLIKAWIRNRRRT
jgi:N-acetylglucosaminyldiphosphoundecaprenol N-acetyl-beta-D-mannosaminyltransferase